MKTLTVSGTLGEFEAGSVLTRGPAIAAYLTLLLNELGDVETTLTAPEILDTYSKTDTSGIEDAADIEATIVDALMDRERGKAEEDEPQIDMAAAIARQSSAYNLGGMLNGKFTEDLVAFLNAKDTIKKTPVAIMDDCRAKWTREQIEMMPMPGSKLAKADKDNVALSNVTYDYYKTTDSNGETIRSSWYMDIILATEEGKRINAILSAKQEEQAKAKDLDTADDIKLERKRLTDAAQALRQGISLSLVLWKLEACPKLEVEVQREADGTPLRTLYPVTVNERGQRGSRKSLTLSQLLGLLKEDKDGMNGIDRTVAKGGTIKAFVDYGLPKKAPGKKGKAVVVANTDQAFNVMFAFNTYLQNGGDGALTKTMNGPKSEDFVMQLGDLVAYLMPIYNSGDTAARYQALNATPAKRKA